MFAMVGNLLVGVVVYLIWIVLIMDIVVLMAVLTLVWFIIIHPFPEPHQDHHQSIHAIPVLVDLAPPAKSIVRETLFVNAKVDWCPNQIL